MKSTLLRSRCGALAVLFTAAFVAGLFTPARADNFDVPDDFATIREAVDAAALSEQVENYINLGQARFTNHTAIEIGSAFSEQRRLTLRPDPRVAALPRVTLVGDVGWVPILRMTDAAHVTVQDLDLIRQTTTFEDLVQIVNCTNIVLERCRVGSNWPTPGAPAKYNLSITQPHRVEVRNCLFFAHAAATFAHAIHASLLSAQNHSLYLYHNVAADYGEAGLWVHADGNAVVVARDNVAANRVGISPEPKAFSSLITDPVTLRSSHNAAFATPANVEQQDSVQSLAGDVLRVFEPAALPGAFMMSQWIAEPADHPNHHFFRLIAGGQLHDSDADAGIAVGNGAPDALDLAVTDDWEKDPRPEGNLPRTDRGADQVVLFVPMSLEYEVTVPGLRSLNGISRWTTVDEGYEIIAIGPQNQPPYAWEGAGGDYRVTGQFISLAATPFVGEQPMLSPVMTVARASGNSLVLSWLLTTPPLVLEATSSLTPPRLWIVPSVPTQIVGQIMTATVPLSEAQRFFRLRH